jgi:hypothetical protein
MACSRAPGFAALPRLRFCLELPLRGVGVGGSALLAQGLRGVPLLPPSHPGWARERRSTRVSRRKKIEEAVAMYIYIIYI